MPGRDRFIEGFAQGFNPQVIANVIIAGIKDKQQKEEERKQKEEQARNQALINDQISNLSQGGESTFSQQPQLMNNSPIPDTNVKPNLGNMVQTPPSLNNLLNTPIVQSPQFKQGYKPYSSVDKVNKAMQISSTPGGEKALGNYFDFQKMFNPQQKPLKYIQGKDDKNLIYEDPLSGRPIKTEILNPQYDPKSMKINPNIPMYDEEVGKHLVYEGYPTDEKPDGKKVRTIDGVNYRITSTQAKEPDAKTITEIYDPQLKARKEAKGYLNPAAKDDDPTTLKYNGQKYTIKEYGVPHKVPVGEKDETGLPTISKDMTKLTDQWHTERENKAMAVREAYQATSEYDPKSKMMRPVGEKRRRELISNTQKELQDFNNNYIQGIKQNMPPKLTKWYDGLYKSNENKDPGGKTFWANFINAYKDGSFKKKIDVSDKNGKLFQKDDPGVAEFAYARELYRGLYGQYPDATNLENVEKGDDNSELDNWGK